MKKLVIIIFVLIAAGLIFVLTDDNTDSLQQSSPDADEEILGRAPQDLTDTIAGNAWFGILKLSDNQDMGNLMLVIDDETKKYIQTSRDFSQLVNQEVVMEVSGPADNFILINIHPKD